MFPAQSTSSTDETKWTLRAQQISPVPDSDALKLLQFLDTAAQGIKLALESSYKPCHKRLKKDSAAKQRGSSAAVTQSTKQRPGKKRKIIKKHDAQDSLDSLFDFRQIQRVKGDRLHQGATARNSDVDGDHNRQLPVSFFVEPALREKHCHKMDANFDKTLNYSFYDSNSYLTYTNVVSSPVCSAAETDDTYPRSPSLPEDTLESILDQGEINMLLTNNTWHQPDCQDKGGYPVSSTASSASTYSVSAEVLSAGTPSPGTSSCDSDFLHSPGPNTPTCWPPYHASALGASSYLRYITPQTCGRGVFLEGQTPFFQQPVYYYGQEGNFSDARLFPKRHKDIGCSTNQIKVSTHPSHAVPFHPTNHETLEPWSRAFVVAHSSPVNSSRTNSQWPDHYWPSHPYLLH